jgi:glycosyltransferase involved in cell wall biosynthesis
MNITIDISQVIYQTGVSTYTANLVENLLKIDKKNKYLLFGGSLRRKEDFKAFTKNLKGDFSEKYIAFPPTLANILWNRFHVIKAERFVGKTDVFHSSDWSEPPTDAFKVTTVHDLAPILFPQFTRPEIVSVHKAKIKWVIKEVDRIIVPSEATKRDLIKMKADKNKISVIPEGVDPDFKPSKRNEIEIITRSLNINKPYLLSIGVGPRKNTQGIIEAHKLVKKEYDLVLVGHDHYGYGEKEGVFFTGHLKKRQLIDLYSGAKVLLYPSFYEGFGLPILEAFACECPVVTSKRSSLPEVAGNAAIYVDPKDANSIAEGINKALKNKDQLVKDGFNRLKMYSWENTARMTLEVYEGANK